MDRNREGAVMATSRRDADALAVDGARRRAGRLRGFYIDCVAFVAGNTVAFVINWMTRGEGGSWWFQWGLLVWATALAIHGLTVLGSGSWLGSEWEDRKVAQFLRARDARSAHASTAASKASQTRDEGE
jgi:hypothetical protein